MAEELEAVQDEVGSERAAIMAELTRARPRCCSPGPGRNGPAPLVLVHTSARCIAGTDYLIGAPPERLEAVVDQFDQLWGTDATAALLVPSRAGDGRFLRWFAKGQRASASPKVAQVFLRAMAEPDVRPALPLVQAPTLILHRRGFGLVPISQGQAPGRPSRGGNAGRASQGRTWT